ncbi:unnamed protein product [Arabidopsis halleri]
MDRGGDKGRRLWYMRNVKLDVMRSHVNSYLEGLPRDQNPPPPPFLAVKLPEVQIAVPLISHVLQLLTVINSDFDSMKEHLNGVELSDISAYEQNARFLVDRFLSGVLDNPNSLDSLGKLHRIRQCLQYVLTLTREYILTHRLLLLRLPEPQPHSFPIAELLPYVEQGTVMSLVHQQTNDVVHLIDLLIDCLMRMLDYDLGKLRMVDLEEVYGFVHKVKTTLEDRAFAKGT